jgi:hypothetical protein
VIVVWQIIITALLFWFVFESVVPVSVVRAKARTG